MDVFVFEWLVPNSLQSNRFEIIFEWGMSYICFFENSASHLDFRFLGGASSIYDPAYRLPSERHSGRVKYKKRMTGYDAKYLRRQCFARCFFHSRERLLLRKWRPTKHSEAHFILNLVSQESHRGLLDQSWSEMT